MRVRSSVRASAARASPAYNKMERGGKPPTLGGAGFRFSQNPTGRRRATGAVVIVSKGNSPNISWILEDRRAARIFEVGQVAPQTPVRPSLNLSMVAQLSAFRALHARRALRSNCPYLGSVARRPGICGLDVRLLGSGFSDSEFSVLVGLRRPGALLHPLREASEFGSILETPVCAD